MHNDIKHTDKNSPTNTRDGMDGGVPMRAQVESDKPHQGPEDAADPHANNRGDYSNRMTGGESLISEVIPESERVPNGPTSRLVPQFPRAKEIGDEPGKKGGVSQ